MSYFANPINDIFVILKFFEYFSDCGMEYGWLILFPAPVAS